MSPSPDHVTIATSTGILWVALVLHFAAGAVGLVSGFVATVAAKGGRWHRKAGLLFVIAMVSLGALGAAIATYEGKFSSVVGGTFTAYLVFTAFTTVRPLAGPAGRRWLAALMVLAFGLALLQLALGVVALGRPGWLLAGVPAPMIVFLGSIALLAAIGDRRLMRAREALRGPRRLARHLWRMTFGLFIASGSFFLGQMKFLPQSLRILPMLAALAVAPLVVLLNWMWRVRFRRRLQGIILRQAMGSREPA